jgi:hypothetical protein
LVTKDAALNLGSFSVQGAAEIDYGYDRAGRRQIKLKAEVKEFSLPATLSAAGKLSGLVEATLAGRGGNTLDLVAWNLRATASDFFLAGLELNGSIGIRYSEIDRGAIQRVPYYQIDANFSDLHLSLPGDRTLSLDSGRLAVSFFEDGTGGNVFSALQDPEKLEIQAKVSNFELTDELTLSGAISLSYADDLYRFSGNVTGLRLPTADGEQSFGGSLSNLEITKTGEVKAWTATAFLDDVVLFDDTRLSGQADLSYLNASGTETFTLAAKVDSFGFAITELDFSFELSGVINLVIVNGALTRWSLNASIDGLSILEFGLSGELGLSYDLRDPLFFNQETIRVDRAAVSVDALGGLVSTDLELSDLVLVNANPWESVSWKARASISLGLEANSSLPLQLAGNLAIAYQHQNPAYANQSTYTLSGSLDRFGFNSEFLSVEDASVELDSLVLTDGEIRSIELSGDLDHLKLADLIDLSGDFGIRYFNQGDSDDSPVLSLSGSLSGLRIGKNGVYDLFDHLGITSASVNAEIAGESIKFLADVQIAPELQLNVGDFSFGLENAGATLRYGYEPDLLELDVNGRLLLGKDNPFPVEGSFSVGINLDSGQLSLRNASLLLTPDNEPLSFGLVELQPGSLLSYQDDEVRLVADVRVNTSLLEAAAAPVYDFINTISPAVKPIVDTLSAEMPVDGMQTDSVSINIPAIKLPQPYVSGYRRVFGIKVPEFSVKLVEIIPAQRVEIIPAMDLGSLLTRYLEDYPGNPYKDNGSVELIEVIDKVASEIFYINQQLARFGVGTAFEPYVALYGKNAFAMDYPALAPFVKTVESLLSIAKQGKTIGNGGWLDLDPIQLAYNLQTGDFALEGGELDEVIAALGGFGDLYNLVNSNPNLTTRQPKPVSDGISGFVDRSSFSVPILDNLPKALLDFLLDKNVDIFEYNIDLQAGFNARAEVAIPGEATAAVIGIPLPIVLGGNFGLGAALDATLGFSAPTKGIKAIASSISDVFTGDATPSLDSVLNLLFDAATEPNSGAYLELTDELVRLDAKFSVDLGLDYKIAGLRGVLGFGTSLLGGLSLDGPSQGYERLYFNNLLGSIFDPNFGEGRTPADLNLGLKLGNTKVWTDLQFKAASPWLSLLRLETRLPMPKSGLTFTLGTIYTGPTFGAAKVFFDEDFDFDVDDSEAFIFSGFRAGTADQDDLFSRISSQLLDDDLTGLLIVQPSADARDVMTGLSRQLALFDYLSPSDRLPDALSVLSSLQALPSFLRVYRRAGLPTPELAETYLNGIDGFAQLDITSASSYQGLASDDPETRDLAWSISFRACFSRQTTTLTVLALIL